eukprot:580765-Alexandrium_andersonii.AAC.1
MQCGMKTLLPTTHGQRPGPEQQPLLESLPQKNAAEFDCGVPDSAPNRAAVRQPNLGEDACAEP